MAILSIQTTQTGETGVLPSYATILTSDPEATILTTGYLNHAVQNGTSFQYPCIAKVATKETSTSDYKVGWYQVSRVGVNTSLVPAGNPGDVVLPTIANHLATYTNTTGGLSEDAATAINGGNIQAGLSGTAGYLATFPATAARGSLRLVGANSVGNTVTQITNASMAAARTFTIPDGGQAASSFLITDSGSTQTIATGSLALTLGNLTVAAGSIAATLGTITAGSGITSTTGNITASAGNVVAGASGAAGALISFPATAANGSLIIAALNAGGAFNTTIRNSAMGQSTVYSLPDIEAATGGIPVSTGAVRMKMVPDATAAGGSATQNFVDAFCTAASVVTGAWQTQTTPASILTIIPGVGSFDVVSSADVGSGTFNYVIFK